jgi:hypothetical protein
VNINEIRVNKKIWEKLIAYFPLTQHGPHRKQNKLKGINKRTDRQPGDIISILKNYENKQSGQTGSKVISEASFFQNKEGRLKCKVIN